MAMVKLGIGITDINGQAGGDYWRTDQCRVHKQAMPRHWKHPPSAKQRKRRRAFRQVLNFWKNNVTWEIAAYWQQYSNNHPHRNKKGELTRLSAINYFLKFNIHRAYNDVALLLWPPAS